MGPRQQLRGGRAIRGAKEEEEDQAVVRPDRFSQLFECRYYVYKYAKGPASLLVLLRVFASPRACMDGDPSSTDPRPTAVVVHVVWLCFALLQLYM